jgi:hypothetical protein
MPQFPKKIGDPRFLTDIIIYFFNAFYISYPKLKEKSFLDLEKNSFINTCSQRKICKEMWRRDLWIRIVHVSSFILLKTQYFFKNNYKIGLLKQNPR